MYASLAAEDEDEEEEDGEEEDEEEEDGDADDVYPRMLENEVVRLFSPKLNCISQLRDHLSFVG